MKKLILAFGLCALGCAPLALKHDLSDVMARIYLSDGLDTQAMNEAFELGVTEAEIDSILEEASE